MKKFPAFIFCVLIFIFSFFLFPKVVLAKILFQDDFDDGNADGWVLARSMQWDNPTQPCLYKGQPAEWVVKDQKLGISIEGPGCVTEIIPNDTLWDASWNDYIFEADIELVSGTDHNIAFRYTDPSSWYGIHFLPTMLDLQRVLPGPVSNHVPYSFQNGNTYHVKIEIRGENIKIFINGELLLDYPYAGGRFPTGRIALQASVGADPSSETYFDNIVVRSIEPELIPTPTPQPLILLPGLGGSWNHEEIFLGIDKPQSEWYKTPFIDSYNSLISTLQNAGYTLEENLFIFYYDWLQPINQTANDLENYIDNVVVPPPGTKVDLVGHSLGGLVARTYVQNNPISHQVDQLITLGSPHKGAPQVYRAWEGADLHQLLGNKERIGAGILLRLRGFGYPNIVQAIRNLVPSLGNLLFIDDYLKWNNSGAIKPESSMFQQNTWLKGLGTSSELLGLTDTVVGTAGATPRWLRIIERNQIDEMLGRWEDGKPVAEESAMGDKIVLEESAQLTGANIVILDGLNHGELVQSAAGIAKILELLGVSDDVEIVEQPTIPFEPALVFTVASPVTLRVTDPLGRQIGAGVDLTDIPDATFSAQEKIIIIPHAIDGKYKVEVISEDGGSYQLLIGQLTQEQDLWSQYQSKIKSNRPNTYILPFDSTLQTTDLYLARLINSKLKGLLRQIQKQRIDLRVKTKLIGRVFRILGQTEFLPPFLKLNMNQKAMKFLQEAILKTTEAIEYAQGANPDSLPPLREILDLLGQLHQLIGS